MCCVCVLPLCVYICIASTCVLPVCIECMCIRNCERACLQCHGIENKQPQPETMLPSQATAPLRRILGPCLRLYQNHHPSPCGFAGTLTDNPKQVFTSVSTPSTSQTVCFASHSGPQGTKAFSTSCTFCDIVREQAEEVEKKSLKFENGEKVQAFSTASFENLISLAQKVESGHQALLILQRLCVLHKEGKTQCADGEILLQDARLSKVSQVLDEQIMRLSPKVLITTLKALYEVSDADVYIVKTLATQVGWLLGYCFSLGGREKRCV